MLFHNLSLSLSPYLSICLFLNIQLFQQYRRAVIILCFLLQFAFFLSMLYLWDSSLLLQVICSSLIFIASYCIMVCKTELSILMSMNTQVFPECPTDIAVMHTPSWFLHTQAFLPLKDMRREGSCWVGGALVFRCTTDCPTALHGGCTNLPSLQVTLHIVLHICVFSILTLKILSILF